MNLYQRTQYTNTTLMALLLFGWLPIVLLFGLRGAGGSLRFLALPAALMAVFFFGFRSLMVTVTTTEVQLAYTSGWPTKTIERASIVSAEPFRLPWWYGVGIRLTPKGWMWSVWGYDTVLLNLSDGSGFLIGTDDPEGLTAALR
ncbi:MAG: hypothetical protein OXS29_17150 [bacterium]|nr:hypothetical protein [bacterium]MDE0287152.1 hypothetical protein [bacterium]MDE0437495.1 hypothetical protein [bacterium]